MRIGAPQYEERSFAGLMPSGALAPTDALNLLTSYRKLLTTPPEGTPGLAREAMQSAVGTAAELAAAAAGFSALADAPDALATFAALFASSLQEAERRSGGGGGGGGGRYDPARPQQRGGGGLDERETLRTLKELLLFAPMLGLGTSARALPPYDGTEARHADDRRAALDQMRRRCEADGALQLLCSDASAVGGAFAFAPLRAVDLNSY